MEQLTKMSKIIGYLRVSTDAQDVASQKMAIENYCNSRGLEKPTQWVEDKMSGTVGYANRSMPNALQLAGAGGVVIVSEVTRIARSLIDVLRFAEDARSKSVEVRICNIDLVIDDSISSKTMIVMMGLAGELERTILVDRTNAGLKNAKAKADERGERLAGRGRNKKYKLDAKKQAIEKLIEQGISKSSIAKLLGCTRNALQAHFDRNMQAQRGGESEK
jgi:DNA invertase Pin-like site-specific DNA recombinase